MLPLSPLKQRDRTCRLLFLGAHSDDIEIGCGGTLLRILKDSNNLNVFWVVFGAHGDRAIEATQSAQTLLAGVRNRNIVTKEFRDGFFPYSGGQIKEYFEELKTVFNPDIIFTHYKDDMHQDHRLISELTWNTFRDHWIVEYEVMKYDGDLGRPNLYVHLDEATCRNKVDHIQASFNSQKNRLWFTADTFYSLHRLRGIESNAPDKYAEAFYCRKMVLQPIT